MQELAVATVNGLALVLFAATGCLLNHFLDGLVESFDEIAAAAEVHLGEHFLNASSDNSAHGVRGKK
jgi:hypothetical protein